MLREIRHPGLVKLYEIYESDQYAILVMEIEKGIDILSRMKAKTGYTEGDAAIIIKSLMSIISAFHDLHIIHRDLNPETLLVSYFIFNCIEIEKTKSK